MKQELYPKEENKIEKLLPKIEDSRFPSGLGCLHCGSTTVKRIGSHGFNQLSGIVESDETLRN